MPVLPRRLRGARAIVSLAVLLGAGCGAASPDDPRERALAEATRLLDDASVFTRLMAAGVLLDAGRPEGWPVLVEGIHDGDVLTRRAAAGALLDVRSADVIPLVQTLIEGDRSLEVVFYAELPHHPRRDADALLHAGLGSENAAVVVSSIDAVTLARRIDLLGAVSRAAQRSGPRSADVLARALNAHATLGKDPQAIAQLVQLAESDDVFLRETAAVGLGGAATPEGRAALLALSEDQNPRVRVAALASRLAQGDEGAEEALEGVLRGPQPDLAELAAGGLKRVPVERALAMIEENLRCCPLEPQVAMRLLESAGWLEGGDARSVLAWGLAQEEPLIRMQTVWAVGTRRDADELPMAVPALRDADNGVRAMAAWALIHGASDHAPRLPDPPSTLFDGPGTSGI